MILAFLVSIVVSLAPLPGWSATVPEDVERGIRVIDSLIKKGSEWDLEMRDAEMERMALRPQASEAAKAKADQKIEALKNKRNLEWSAAMVEAVKLFKIAKLPLEGTGTIAPLDGVPMRWRMTVGSREARKIKDKHGRDFTLPAAPHWAGAETDLDGTTTVFASTLKRPDGTLIPAAELGLLLLHERVHFKHATSPSTGLTKAQAEIGARATVLRHLDLFPIRNPDGRRRELKDDIAAFQKVERGEAPDIRYQALMRFYDTTPGSMYTPRELAAIDDLTVEAMGRADEEERLLSGPEPLKARGEYEFLDGWRAQAAALSKRIERSRERARQEEARRQRERWQRREAERLVREAASKCGLEADGPAIWSFRVASTPHIKLRFRYDDVGQARAAFLVAQACLWPDHDEYEACTDGVEIMSSRWGNIGFRDSLLMGVGTHDYVIGCFRRIVQAASPPRDFRQMRREAARELAAWQERDLRERRRKEQERPREERRSSPTPQPSRGDGDDTFWSPELQRWIRRVPRR